jgi:hypothetical protein
MFRIVAVTTEAEVFMDTANYLPHLQDLVTGHNHQPNGVII